MEFKTAVMLGILVFIPTLFFVPHYAYLLCIPLIGWNYWLGNAKGEFKKHIEEDKHLLILMIAFVAMSLINNLIHWSVKPAGSDALPFAPLLFLVYFIARQMRQLDFSVLIVLIVLETGVAVVEYIKGVPTFFQQVVIPIADGGEDLLYYHRPFGLSSNSSIIGLKILLALLLIRYVRMGRNVRWLLIGALLIGVVVTFNRTVILAVGLYGLLLAVDFVLKMRLKPDVWKRMLLFSGVIFLMILAVTIWKHEALWMQLTRGKGVVEFSGRYGIWQRFMAFIQSNFFFGNGSYKFVLESGKHAHNSFFQVIATHGFWALILYLMMIYAKLKLRDVIAVIVLLFYSYFQYGIFWGISLTDIVLFVFLVNPHLVLIPWFASGKVAKAA